MLNVMAGVWAGYGKEGSSACKMALLRTYASGEYMPSFISRLSSSSSCQRAIAAVLEFNSDS